MIVLFFWLSMGWQVSAIAHCQLAWYAKRIGRDIPTPSSRLKGSGSLREDGRPVTRQSYRRGGFFYLHTTSSILRIDLQVQP